MKTLLIILIVLFSNVCFSQFDYSYNHVSENNIYYKSDSSIYIGFIAEDVKYNQIQKYIKIFKTADKLKNYCDSTGYEGNIIIDTILSDHNNYYEISFHSNPSISSYFMMIRKLDFKYYHTIFCVGVESFESLLTTNLDEHLKGFKEYKEYKNIAENDIKNLLK